jgi:hypothetical protein
MRMFERKGGGGRAGQKAGENCAKSNLILCCVHPILSGRRTQGSAVELGMGTGESDTQNILVIKSAGKAHPVVRSGKKMKLSRMASETGDR